METYLVSEDIAEGADCIVIARIGGKPYLAAKLGRAGDIVGTASEALPRGREVQLSEGDFSLTANARVYRVVITPS